MIAIQHLEAGTRLKLKDATIVEVVENPRDGTWLVVRPVGPDGIPEGATDLVHADDVEDEIA